MGPETLAALVDAAARVAEEHADELTRLDQAVGDGDYGASMRRGFAVEPRRWKIEQTLGCLQRYRRLLVDHEGDTGMSPTVTLPAALFTTGDRFERQIMA